MWLSILCVLQVLFINNECFSSNLASDMAGSSINSLDDDFTFFVLSRSHHLSSFELKLSWEILIQNRYFALCVISEQFLFSIYIIQFNEEIVVWVPLIVIVNSNLNRCLIFILFHG